MPAPAGSGPNGVQPLAASRRDTSGSASALMGSLQFGVATGAAFLVGALHDGSAMPLALVISLCGCGAVACGRRQLRAEALRPAGLLVEQLLDGPQDEAVPARTQLGGAPVETLDQPGGEVDRSRHDSNIFQSDRSVNPH